MLRETLNSALDVFRTKSPSLIGVDISSTSIKLVELSDAGNGAYRLERYAVETLPKDTVTDGNIANLDQVSEALRRAVKRLGSHNRKVALALPAAMVITKKIIVPSGQKEEELELAVEAEANQYIPFALDEVNLDFQVLGPVAEQSRGGRDPHRGLAQGEGRGPGGDRGIGGSQAPGHGRRVLRHAGGVPAHRADAARRAAATRTSPSSTSAPTSPISMCCATTSSCSPGTRRSAATS